MAIRWLSWQMRFNAVGWTEIGTSNEANVRIEKLLSFPRKKQRSTVETKPAKKTSVTLKHYISIQKKKPPASVVLFKIIINWSYKITSYLTKNSISSYSHDILRNHQKKTYLPLLLELPDRLRLIHFKNTTVAGSWHLPQPDSKTEWCLFMFSKRSVLHAQIESRRLSQPIAILEEKLDEASTQSQSHPEGQKVQPQMLRPTNVPSLCKYGAH